MNDIFGEIKQIPISEVLDKLGIKYKKVCKKYTNIYNIQD